MPDEIYWTIYLTPIIFLYIHSLVITATFIEDNTTFTTYTLILFCIFLILL